MTAFRQGLKEAGYRRGPERSDRMSARRTRKIVAGTGGRIRSPAGGRNSRQWHIAALAAKAATTTIPIVFASGDPVRHGLVASLSRPDGNVTGITSSPARLGANGWNCCTELVPRQRRLPYSSDPRTLDTEAERRDVQAAAKRSGSDSSCSKSSNGRDLESSYRNHCQRGTDALLVGTGAFMTSQRERWSR